MKIEREIETPCLYKFARHALPVSLTVKCVAEGYGSGYYVYQRGSTPSFAWLGNRGDPIAELYGDSIRLFHHNYFSDMEALARAYESATGHEITLRYSQVPKEKPLA